VHVPRSALPVELYDNGPHYVFVERDTPEEIAALAPDLSRLAALGSTAFSVYAKNDKGWNAGCSRLAKASPRILRRARRRDRSLSTSPATGGSRSATRS